VSPGSISFQTTLEKIRTIDTIAKRQRRSRDLVLNEALDIYLGLQAHHLVLIENGIHDVGNGRVISQTAVREVSKTWSHL
jgi:predicted transcriptional regulator